MPASAGGWAEPGLLLEKGPDDPGIDTGQLLGHDGQEAPA